MKSVRSINIIFVCLCMLLSSILVPPVVSIGGPGGFSRNGPQGGGGSNGPTVYGYIHLDNSVDVEELTNHQISITNQRTSFTDYAITNQYGFYAIEPTNAQYTDTLRLEVTYFDPGTQETIYGSTIIPVSNYMRADPTFILVDQVCDWYEDINAPPYYPPPHPDLLLIGAHFYHHEQGLELIITIRNIGLVTANNILFNVYDGPTFLGGEVIDRIDADSYGYDSIIWIDPSEGVHEIIITVDPLNSIFEIIETNNDAFVDCDVLIETNGLRHFVWENIGDRQIHYLNNIDCDWIHTQWTLSWSNNPAINPQIEIDSNRVLHVTWIEETPEGLIFRYAWSYNHIWTWFDRYELTPSAPEYELNYDAIQDLVNALVEILGEWIEKILDPDPNPDPPTPPPPDPIVDKPPEIEITDPEDDGWVLGQTIVTGTTKRGTHPILTVWVKFGASGEWKVASDTSTAQDWSTWECEEYIYGTSGTPMTITAQVKDTANPANIRYDAVDVKIGTGDTSGYTNDIEVVENHIFHNGGAPGEEHLYDDPYLLKLSPWVQDNGNWVQWVMKWRSKHRVQDSDRELDQYTKSIIIRCDSWYDIYWVDWETEDEEGTGIPNLNRWTGDNSYEGHRQDVAGQYTQDDIDNGVDITYTQLLQRQTPSDGTAPPNYETHCDYRATIRTRLTAFTNKLQDDGSLYKTYYETYFKSWKEHSGGDEALRVYV